MTEEKPARKRASRYKRPKSPRRMRLTQRDKVVVKAANDFRVMRQAQLQRLLFPSRNTAQIRLRLLWEHGYLKREFLPVVGGIQTSPILYLVDKRGVELLRSEFGYEDNELRWSRGGKLSPRFLEHTLGLSEIRLAVALACRAHEFRLKTWLDEKALKADYARVQVGARLISVLPDAYFVITLPAGDLHFFLEYDRGDEPLKVFKQKLVAYWAYFRSPKCRDRYGTNRIRVLTVTEGGETRSGRKRLANLKKLAAQIEGRHWFWFSSLAQASYDGFFLAPFWERAGSGSPSALVGAL